MLRIQEAPSPSECAAKVGAVPVLRAVTEAFGATDPVASVTTPVKVPFTSWQKAGQVSSRAASERRIFFMDHLSCSPEMRWIYYIPGLYCLQEVCKGRLGRRIACPTRVR